LQHCDGSSIPKFNSGMSAYSITCRNGVHETCQEDTE
jgi:hypothetical protein